MAAKSSGSGRVVVSIKQGPKAGELRWTFSATRYRAMSEAFAFSVMDNDFETYSKESLKRLQIIVSAAVNKYEKCKRERRSEKLTSTELKYWNFISQSKFRSLFRPETIKLLALAYLQLRMAQKRQEKEAQAAKKSSKSIRSKTIDFPAAIKFLLNIFGLVEDEGGDLDMARNALFGESDRTFVRDALQPRKPVISLGIKRKSAQFKKTEKYWMNEYAEDSVDKHMKTTGGTTRFIILCVVLILLVVLNLFLYLS
eukprot:TRINITY_DN11181_c0_g1_i1.p1 TRINITY_DN11181_c0_g1~~TRINITY_DN11181_c0_g1_i1.p1  ORF type:complete len:255 (-),score=36.22 TRINITY_DN11181_c0_g1_i1:620-1384(-)